MWPFGRSKQLTRGLPDPEAVEWSNFTQIWPNQTTETPPQTFLQYVIQGYASCPPVFACSQARIRLLAQAEFKWQNLTTRQLFGTPDLAILEEPWPNGTSADLIAHMVEMVDLAGNSFARRAGDRLVTMRPDWTDIVSVIIDEGEDPDGNVRSHREIIGYLYSEGGKGVGDPTFYDVADVAHWCPLPDPLSQSGRGMSWMTPILREINADTSMTRHRQTFFDNAATPNIILKYAGKLKPEQLDRIKSSWRSRFSGEKGAGATVILDEGADLSVVGSTFESMRFNDIQAAGEARIASAAGVPPIVAHLQAGLDASTYHNYGLAYRAFSTTTCAHLWASLCSALAKLVPAQGGARLWYDTTSIPALQENEKDRADAMQVWAAAASTLLTAGYTAESITKALTSGDLTQLQHSGMISVQLIPNDIASLKKEQLDLKVLDKAAKADGKPEPDPAALGSGSRSEPLALPVPPSQQTFNISIEPSRSEAPSVTVYPPDAPQVTVNVEPTPVTVQVEPTPVTVEAPRVTVDAPVTVLPASPEVTVVPVSGATTRRVVRDADGNITKVVEE